MKYNYRLIASTILKILILYGFLTLDSVKGDNSDDSECISRGGTCQTDSLECTGGYETGLCSGSTNRRCCLPNGCKLMAYEGICDFYDQCLNNFVKSDLEAFVFAKNYCNRLVNNYRYFDEQGQNWNIGVRKCVMKNLYKHYYDSYTNDVLFDDLLLRFTLECNLKFSLTSRPICLIFESSRPTNLIAFAQIYEFNEDIFNYFWQIAAEQMVEILMNCIAKYPYYSKDFQSDRFPCNNANIVELISEEKLDNTREGVARTIKTIFNEIQKKTTNKAPELFVTESCESWAIEGNCNFFKNCLEERFPCYNEGFALDEGYKFCKQLEDKLNLFDLAGASWAINTRTCLTKEMLPVYKSSEALSCQHIRATGLDALIACIPGNMVCSLVVSYRNAFAASEIFQIQNEFVQPQIRKYGISFETIMTYSMRFCYGFNVIPFCFKQVNGQEMRLKTDKKTIEPEEQFNVKSEVSNWNMKDLKCFCSGGECKIKDTQNTNCLDGRFFGGKCSGNANRQCCIPDIIETESSCIDSSFLCIEEGFSPIGYVPTYNDGTVIGKSGVTIGIGVDLGSERRDYLKYNFPESIMTKFEPYFGKKKKMALEELNKKKLILTILEATLVSKLVEEKFIEDIKIMYNKEVDKKDIDGLLKFSQLTLAQRTVIVSVFFNVGLAGGPTFLDYTTSQSWEEAIRELTEFFKTTDCSKNVDRRCREAKMLEEDDQSGRNTTHC